MVSGFLGILTTQGVKCPTAYTSFMFLRTNSALCSSGIFSYSASLIIRWACFLKLLLSKYQGAL